MTQTQIRHDVPDTFRDALESFRRTRVRFYCATHGNVQAVASVSSIEQLSESAEYQVALACGCTRTVSLAVNRTPSGKDKLTRQKAEKREFAERQTLLAAMKSAGTL
jgi:hypothetical protein